MLAFSYSVEPIVVGIGTMRSFEPFVNEKVRSVIVKFLAHQLAHRETWWYKLGIIAAGHRLQRRNKDENEVKEDSSEKELCARGC